MSDLVKYCSNCGVKNDKNADFCINCGEKLIINHEKKDNEVKEEYQNNEEKNENGIKPIVVYIVALIYGVSVSYFHGIIHWIWIGMGAILIQYLIKLVPNKSDSERTKMFWLVVAFGCILGGIIASCFGQRTYVTYFY